MRVLAVFALLALAGAAAAQAPFAANLYECITKARMTYLKAMVDAAGLQTVLSDPNLAVTLLAPDNTAWIEYIDDQGKSWAALKKDPAFILQLKKLLTYHLLAGKYPTSAWPKYKSPAVVAPSLVPDLTWDLYSDADGDFNVEGVNGDAELNCAPKVNYVCGKSLMHSIDEVIYPEVQAK